MKLSIIIPTRNRAKALDATLATFCAIIQASPRKRDIELVCVDNFSQDDTQAVCQRYASEYAFVRYFHHATEWHSAETSAFNAIDFASGEYVWLFGDDDTPLDGCIETVLSALDEYNPSFALLNLLFDRGDESSDYINSVNPAIYFRNGLDFFKRFGLINAVTTISCICFRKSSFDRRLFDEFAQISEIYSHTFGLFANYHDAPVLFVSRPVVKYLATPAAAELEKIGGHSRSKGRPIYYSFGHGLARLIEAASRISGVPIDTIAGFEEMVVDKQTFRVRPMLMWTFIARMFIFQHQQDPFNRFRKGDIAELQSIAAKLNNSSARLCWDACVQISSLDHRAQEAEIIRRVAAILDDYEDEYFRSSRLHEPVDRLESIYFQNGVAPVIFSSNSPPASLLPSLVFVIQVDREDDPRRVMAALQNSQKRLKDIDAKWVLWTCSDPSEWRCAAPLAEVMESNELPVERIAQLGEYAVFVRPGSLLFPNSLLFALNLLVRRGADAAVLNFGSNPTLVRTSYFYGELPSEEMIREMRWEEAQAVHALLKSSPSRMSMIAATDSLQGRGITRALHVNCPLSFDTSFISQPCEILSQAADSIVTSSGDMISKLVALNRLTIGGLLSNKAVAPVLADHIAEIYRNGQPDIETAIGAMLMENLLLLLAIRCGWENTWTFSECIRDSLANELHQLNSMLTFGGNEVAASRKSRREQIEKSRSKRQTRYTELVEWVNKRPKVRRLCEKTVRIVSKTRIGRRHVNRLHHHYYHPMV